MTTWLVETTDVSELDVVRVAVGDRATITFTALPGVDCHGHGRQHRGARHGQQRRGQLRGHDPAGRVPASAALEHVGQRQHRAELPRQRPFRPTRADAGHDRERVAVGILEEGHPLFDARVESSRKIMCGAPVNLTPRSLSSACA